MSSRAWPIFRKFRVVVFVLSTFLAMAWTVIYAVLLMREWNVYTGAQRAIIITLLAIDGISTILLYLMTIVQFRPWLDGARIAFLVLFQVGGTVTFALFRTTFPCDRLGSQQDCQLVTSIAIFGGWSLSALLLIYALSLAVMVHIPLPTPAVHPESIITENSTVRAEKGGHSSNSSVASDSWLLKRDEKRHSLNSVYSQRSFIETYVPPPSRNMTPALRSPSITSGQRVRIGESYGVYRPDTPQSLYSPTTSSISRASTPAQSVFRQHMEHSMMPTHRTLASAPAPGVQLPNPFAEPLSRHGTPASMLSMQSARSEPYYGQAYRPPQNIFFGHDRSLSSPLTSPRHYLPSSVPPPYMGSNYNSRSQSVDRSLVSFPPMTPGLLTVPGTPMSLRPSVRAGNFENGRAPSPGAQSLSASVHSLGRNDSMISVPRSPSSASISSPLGLPSTPRSAVLAAHPRLPLKSPGMTEASQIRRYGSVPNLGPPNNRMEVTNTTPAPIGTPNWLGAKVNHPVDFRQWKQDVVLAVETRS
ncbi:hypothetical protein BDQ12DRAFT_676621 [Crucibulum laeve]|uniref:Uncharacterized protein n=1 Tax=Crucibulum laeve TaxID=68775 RepID=A0A5C3MBI6_9AGAR|nr:hypothetical protein BDQ12DRAFT_676621 [Crucibulum laeve]